MSGLDAAHSIHRGGIHEAEDTPGACLQSNRNRKSTNAVQSKSATMGGMIRTGSRAESQRWLFGESARPKGGYCSPTVSCKARSGLTRDFLQRRLERRHHAQIGGRRRKRARTQPGDVNPIKLHARFATTNDKRMGARRKGKDGGHKLTDRGVAISSPRNPAGFESRRYGDVPDHGRVNNLGIYVDIKRISAFARGVYQTADHKTSALRQVERIGRASAGTYR